MKRGSITGYARALRALDDALRDHVDGETLDGLMEVAMEDPRKALVELHALALSNHVLSGTIRDKVDDALELVEDDGDVAPLEEGERADLILEWHRARRPKGMLVEEVAEELGVSEVRVRAMISDAQKRPGPGKLRGEKRSRVWVIDPDSVAEVKRDREARGITGQRG